MTGIPDRIRATLVGALEDVDAAGRVEPSRLAAFERGDADLSFDELGLDSLARMELLVALEMEHGAVVAPRDLAGFASLGDLVSHVERLSAAPGAATDAAGPWGEPAPDPRQAAPPVIRLLRRVLRGCRAVAQLHKALKTLEHRATPLEVAELHEWHRRGELVPPGAPARYGAALSEWLERLERWMAGSGKAEPEPFVAHRIAPAALHFAGPGERSAKALLVCFTIRGYRHLWIPHAALLQHVDARAYDVLVLSDPWHTGFRSDVPHMGATVADVVEWVAGLELLADYGRLRTLGCSGGGYPAMLTGRRLGAELSVSVSGRFPSERHPLEILGMIHRCWRSARRHPDTRVLMAHSETKSRDRAFARRLSWIAGGRRLAVGLSGAELGHNLLEPLVEQGELGSFLRSTVFAPVDSELVAGRGRAARVTFPRERSTSSGPRPGVRAASEPPAAPGAAARRRRA